MDRFATFNCGGAEIRPDLVGAKPLLSVLLNRGLVLRSVSQLGANIFMLPVFAYPKRT